MDDIKRMAAERAVEMVRDGMKVGLGTGSTAHFAIETIGRPIPNTPMIGALIRVSGAMQLETVFHDIEKKFLKKLGQRVVDGNISAVKRAYEEVQSE